MRWFSIQLECALSSRYLGLGLIEANSIDHALDRADMHGYWKVYNSEYREVEYDKAKKKAEIVLRMNKRGLNYDHS